MNTNLFLGMIDATFDNAVSKEINKILSKEDNIGKRKREQSQETQLRKIALAEQKRERKALKKGIK